MTRPLSQARGAVVTGLRIPWRPIHWLVSTWRRSVQFRVVAGTLLLSSAVILVMSWALLRQVTDGLLEAHREASVRDSTGGIKAAQDAVQSSDPSDDPTDLSARLARDLNVRGAYDVIVEFSPGTGHSVVPSVAASGVKPSSVPNNLRKRVSTDDLVWRYAMIERPDVEPRPGLIAGAMIRDPRTSANVTVYYLFDLRAEENTLALLKQALLAVGILIVVLLGFVAWFVTRQVVTPVRMARQIAERLAAGLLDERMQVHGEDDLARLATSFNQMAASLQRQIRQLEELSRVQRRFVSDVSHELRTPLTTVRMAADLLYESRPDFDPGTARSAELLHNELDRFEALLSDLLEISRFDAGAAGLELEHADLRTLTRDSVDGVRSLAVRKGSRLDLVVPDEPAVAEVDPRRIERVLRNLMANAVEYGEGRGITIRVVADEDSVAVSVRDHGIGLEPGQSAMVFDRFWRADPARARTTGGTGLGLAIAMEDVLLHGGWLQAWGEPGGGSHFRMTLPRRLLAPLDHSPIPLVPTDRGPVGRGQPVSEGAS